jgi:phosphatidylinositol alpha 1,6-mannosyltransferase
VGAGPAEAMLRQHMPGAIFLGERQGEELAAIYASLDVQPAADQAGRSRLDGH